MNENSLISPEVLVPRLGEQLVDMGMLTKEQLQEVLVFQNENNQNGRQMLLGQAIVEKGFIDRPALDRAVTEQILHLRAALEDANHHLEQRVQQRTLELESALRKLYETSQWKSNFVANISHELRTPLQHIQGYLDLLFTETLGAINPDQKKALDVSLQASLRLKNLIDNLILFSQASRGQMALNIEAVDLKALALDVLDRLMTRIKDRQLKLDIDIESKLPKAQADEKKITWVLNQLLENAVKFTDPGGKIGIAIKRDRAAENILIVSISDTGIGISQDQIKEIFEPFHQLDETASRQYGGTGLGLSLALEIIEAHGSKINVKSAVDQGTTMSFPLSVFMDN